MYRQIPNALTLGRIGLIPLFVGACYWPQPKAGAVAAFTLFFLASITDWFDGWLARRWDAGSDLGKCFDPIADKLLIVTALFMLPRLNGLYLLPALLIAGREIFISGLREYLAGQRIVLHVTGLAKWKTALQMLAIGLIVLSPAVAYLVAPVLLLLLWGAAALTWVTGWDYFRKAWPHLRGY